VDENNVELENACEYRFTLEPFEEENDQSNRDKRYQQEPFSAKKITNESKQAFHNSVIFLFTGIAKFRAEIESLWASAN